MKELIIMSCISGFTFLLFLVTFIVGMVKKNSNLKLISFILFFVFFGLTSWMAVRYVSKTYEKLTKTLIPRTGDEIYDALFDKRETDCVKIINFQDQVIPKVDIAIWLKFETCPAEFKRILSLHEFSVEKYSKAELQKEIITSETLEWFIPTTLGDTIIVYGYATSDRRNIQTIWSNIDSTKVFVRDILD